MAFFALKGDWEVKYLPTKASTAYVIGDMICNDGTDNTVATTSSLRNIGICLQAKAAGDTGVQKLPFHVPRSPFATMLGSVGSGTPAAANVGKTCDFATSSTVAWGTDTHHQLVIEGFISATFGEFSINSSLSTLPGA